MYAKSKLNESFVIRNELHWSFSMTDWFGAVEINWFYELDTEKTEQS